VTDMMNEQIFPSHPHMDAMASIDMADRAL